MSQLRISEAGTVQFPMVKHAVEIGWSPLGPDEARQKRGGDSGMLFRDVLTSKLAEFNAWLTGDLSACNESFQDFVIVHELLHLRVPNHGRLFKTLLTVHIPQWRELDLGRKR